jgi:TonB family protein
MSTTLANWLSYGIVVAALLSVAAWAGEKVLRGVRGEGRWAWVAALAGSLLLPVASYLELPRLFARAASPSAPEAAFVTLPPIMVVAPGSALAPAVDRWLLVLWATASLALAAFVVLSVWRLRRLRRTARRAEVDGVAVYVTRGLGPAAVGGGASGGILMPEWAMSLDARWRRLMLLHETEHLRARDPWLVLGATALLVLVPWNAPMWWQLRRLRLAIELDCDSRVLAREPDARAYGTLLLEVGRRRSLSPLVASFAEPRAFLHRRIRNIVDRGPDSTRRLTGLAFLACGFMLLAAFASEPVSRTAAGVAVAPLQAAPGPHPDTWSSALRIVSVVPRADEPGASPDGPVLAGPGTGIAPRVLPVDTPPPLPRAELERAPVFTPMTTPPQLINRAEVTEALQRLYPVSLRDAGIGGTPTVWFFIDETGRVVQTRLHASSGYPALDEAALRTADIMRFSGARNRDRPVPVWVSIPIVFASPVARDGMPPILQGRPVPVTNLPPPPARVAPPAVATPPAAPPATGVPTPTTNLPPPPPRADAAQLAERPVFTPMTVPPELRNRREVQQALERSYPALLRDAGIGGTPTVWFFIDEDGRVQRTMLHQSSGHQALDEAALRVAAVMEFAAAINRDRRVPVWVSIPIVFTAR